MNEMNHKTSEIVKFQWCQEVSQYGDKLLQRLNNFRKKNMFYDVTLQAADASLAAHKVVLAACGGMFRSHFIDPKTKKILGNVTDVNFACPAAGLKPILKFAYSGVLEITEENLFPTFLAATVTEMKEVQEICVNIATSRFAWIVDFDGSLQTVPRLTSEGKMSDDEAELTLEDTFALLEHLLHSNVNSFASTDGTNMIKSGKENVFLCLNEVEERWPKLTSVYKSLVICLRKIKAVQEPSEENNSFSEKQNVDADILASKVALNVGEGEVDKNTSSEAKTEPNPAEKTESEDSETFSSENKSTSCSESAEVEELKTVEGKESKLDESAVEKKQLDGKVSVDEKDKISKQEPSDETVVSVEPKPTTKPRTKSVAQEVQKNSSNGRSGSPVPPTAHKRQSSLSKTPLKAAAPQPTTNSGPRKKHAAPKPPGPPPSAKSTPSAKKPSPLDSPQRNRPPSKHGNATPGSVAKAAPPRPKPPSVSKNKKDSNPGAIYDDALNPFADDDSAEERSDGYDDALNPFG